MSESFATLFEDSLATTEMKPGSIISGIIVGVTDDWITVHVGLKSEGLIPVSEFEENVLDSIQVGDDVKVVMESVDDGWGKTRVSREKARREEVWKALDDAFVSSSKIEGIICGKVKGGYTVDVQSVRTFLPGSLLDVRPIRVIDHLENVPLDFKVIKIDRKRNNVVVSRRAVLEVERNAERQAVLDTIEEGQVHDGVVKNITDYGAFVDLGGVDGLLHITDMAWRRIQKPADIVEIGDNIKVKILKFDKAQNRVSLGLKQLEPDPWLNIKERYPENSKHKAKVTNLVGFGCFAEIIGGVEGLVHVSEMDWTNKNIQPNKLVSLGDEIEVMVLEIDEERRRISLGMKQCKFNPWLDFSANHDVGDKITGKIKSITDFGIFLGLEGTIDGLVHVTDISWKEGAHEDLATIYSLGQDIDVLILGIDADRQRISLGIKQLDGEEFNQYATEHEKNSTVTGIISEVNKKEAFVKLTEDIQGTLRVGEVDSNEYIEDLRTRLHVGKSIDAKIINMDFRNRVILLSIKALNEEQQKLSGDQNQQNMEKPTTFGSLLKEEIMQNATNLAREESEAKTEVEQVDTSTDTSVEAEAEPSTETEAKTSVDSEVNVQEKQDVGNAEDK